MSTQVPDAIALAERLTNTAGEAVRKALSDVEFARKRLTEVSTKIDTSTDEGVAQFNDVAETLFKVNILATELRGVLG